LPDDVPLKQQIMGSINEARGRAGMPLLADAAPAAKTAPETKAAAPAAKAAAPEKKTAVAEVKPASPAAGEKAAPAAGAARVAGTIALSEQLRAKVAPGDTVVIFARAAEGSKMPLALLRVQAKDLPKTFALDDSMAVAPEFKLSNFAEVVVGARVSKTGSPMPQKGDFEGLSKPVKLGRSDIAVTIDTELR
jgi:cytochrome c-type biogenesis protein CcmH